MKLSDYKKEALRSEQPLAVTQFDNELLLEVLDAAVQMADAVDLIKKFVVYGRPYSPVQLRAALEKVVDVAMHAKHLTLTTTDPTPILMNPRLLHAALGHYGEAGESLSALIPQGHGGQLDIDNVMEEAGDKLWYTALELDEIERLVGTRPADICQMNVAKLSVRYPEKFNLAASEGRDTAAEMQAMRAAAGRLTAHEDIRAA
jgi:NTP pyrophosphatase (non-canonical NTP hydrolase)